MVNPVEIILVPTLMICLGYFLKTIDVLKSEDSKVLTKIVLNVCLPSLIFVNLSRAYVSSGMISLPFFSLGLSIFCVVIAFLFCKVRGYSKVKMWTIIIASSMMNTGFLGFPIMMAVLGNEGFLNAIFFDLGTTLIFVFYGMLLVGLFGGSKKEVIKQAKGFTPLWAVVLALIFNVFNLRYGYVIENTLNYLGQATTPLIMISLGLTLDLKEIRNSFADSFFVSILKLIVAPFVMFLFLNFIGFGGLSFKVAVLEAGMATAMNALVLSINYDLDVKLMSSLILTNTVLCLVTLTGWIVFLT